MKVRCDYCGKKIEVQSMDDIEAHLKICKNYQDMMKMVGADYDRRHQG